MKKIAVLLLAIIISLCAISSAFAANWVEVYRDNKFLISVDVSSLQYNGKTIRVWEKWIYSKENITLKELLKVFKKTVAFSFIYNEYDVNNRTNRRLANISYDKNGNILSRTGESYQTIIAPDTVVDYLFNIYKKVLKIK